MLRTIKGLALSLVLAMAMLAPTTAFASETDESWMQDSARLSGFTDGVGLLTNEENDALNEQAQAIEEAYNFGVYILILEDYSLFFDYDNPPDAAMALYKNYSLGVGDGKDGLLLMLSMDERDYALVAYGDTGTYAFNDEGRALMAEFFLDDFAEDNWYAGFEDFLAWCPAYLDAAAAGEPYSYDNDPMASSTTDDDDPLFTLAIYILAIILIPLIIMLVVIKGMDSKMKSVAAATEASRYVTGSLHLTQRQDMFSHTTEEVTKKANSNSTSSHSGGFSGTSGKF